MATIRKRGGRWQVQVRLTNAKSKTRSFKTKPEALAWARMIEAEISLRSTTGNSSISNYTFGETIEKYLARVTAYKKGHKEETYRLKKIAHSKLWKKQISKITPQDMAEYRDTRLKYVSSASVRRELVILKHLFSVASFEWGLFSGKNPVSLIKIPQCSPARDRRLSSDELEIIFDSIGPKTTVPLKKIILFALETGMRRSEILQIKKKQLDLTNKVLKIPTSKNGKPREIPLTKRALEILSDIDYEFCTSDSALRMAWQRTIKRAGIYNLRFHDLRHEAISRFFEKGLNVSEIMQISGHSDVKSLMRYTHPRPRDIANKLDQIPSEIATATITLKQSLIDAASSHMPLNQLEYENFKDEVENIFYEKFGFRLMSSAAVFIQLASQTSLKADDFIDLLGVAFHIGT